MINLFRSLRILNTRSNAWSALVNQSRSVFTPFNISNADFHSIKNNLKM